MSNHIDHGKHAARQKVATRPAFRPPIRTPRSPVGKIMLRVRLLNLKRDAERRMGS